MPAELPPRRGSAPAPRTLRLPRLPAATSRLAVPVFLVSACLLAAALPGRALAEPRGPAIAAGTGFGPATQARLSAALEATMTAAGAPGAIAGVWQGNRSWVVARGNADVATGAPMQLDDHFRIASNTKAVVATVVLELAGQGRLHLSDPVSRYVSGVPNGQNITIRDLLQHTSGLPNYTDAAFQAQIFAQPTRRYTTSQLLALAFTHTSGPLGQFAYSNTNYLLLGEVIQKITHQPLSAALAEGVFDPLGLTQTAYPAGPQLVPPYAHGFVSETPGAPLTDITALSPTIAGAAGAITSDLADLRTLATAIGDGTLLTAATQQQRLSTVAIPGSPAYVRYGLGLIVMNDFYGHNGEIPGFISVMMRSPSRDITIVAVLNNSTSGGSTALALFERLSAVIAPGEPWAH